MAHNDENVYLERIAELRIEFEKLVKQIDELNNKRDTAMQDESRAKTNLQSLAVQISTAQEQLFKINNAIEANQKSFELDNKNKIDRQSKIQTEINKLEQRLASLQIEVNGLLHEKQALLPAKRELDEVKSQIVQEKDRLAKLNKKNTDLQAKVDEKIRFEAKESEKLVKLRQENENYTLKIEQLLGKLDKEKNKIKKFCAENNIPFTLGEEFNA